MLALTPDMVFAVLDQVKWWAGILGALVFGGRIVGWFKDIRAKDLKEIQSGVVTTQSELVKQTEVLQKGFYSLETSHTRDIQELRNDFRTFFAFGKPAMAAAASGPPRKKSARSGRPTVKVKAKTRRKNTKRK
jgi:hypothetical protein